MKTSRSAIRLLLRERKITAVVDPKTAVSIVQSIFDDEGLKFKVKLKKSNEDLRQQWMVCIGKVCGERAEFSLEADSKNIIFDPYDMPEFFTVVQDILHKAKEFDIDKTVKQSVKSVRSLNENLHKVSNDITRCTAEYIDFTQALFNSLYRIQRLIEANKLESAGGQQNSVAPGQLTIGK